MEHELSQMIFCRAKGQIKSRNLNDFSNLNTTKGKPKENNLNMLFLLINSQTISHYSYTFIK